jgi:hypothetical protein
VHCTRVLGKGARPFYSLDTCLGQAPGWAFLLLEDGDPRAAERALRTAGPGYRVSVPMPLASCLMERPSCWWSGFQGTSGWDSQ